MAPPRPEGRSRVSTGDVVPHLALLAGLQFVVASLISRLPRSRALFTSPPTLLLQDGVPLAHALTQQRMTLADLRQVVRTSGTGDLSRVVVVVLESDGSLSVITAEALGDASALQDVQRPGASAG